MKLKSFMLFLFMASAVFPQSITLLSPNGGERFSPGQNIVIKWKQKLLDLSNFQVSFSFDNGKYWAIYNTVTCDSVVWMVPYSSKGTDRALIKVETIDSRYLVSDVSDRNFSIAPAAPDAYEPNDGFESASPISTGDSVVKNAFVFNGTDADSSIIDQDFYKLTLAGGATASFWIWAGSYEGADTIIGLNVDIALYDSSKSLIDSSYMHMLTCAVPKSGVYYCRITCPWKHWFCKYSLSIRQGGTGITVLSPNGGETLSGGQTMTVNWTQGGSVVTTAVEYTLDGGTNWRSADYWKNGDPNSVSWIVPYLQNTSDKVKVRVKRTDKTGLFPLPTDTTYDCSDSFFTVLAAPPDAYEPNNSFASAYPITVGDSVVTNAIIIGPYERGADPAASRYKQGYFKVDLTGGKIVTISIFDYGYHERVIPVVGTDVAYAALEVYDSSLTQLAGEISDSLSCGIPTSGVYYLKLYVSSHGGLKYGLSIHQEGGSVKCLSPAGGERFNPGDSVTIRWTKDKGVTTVDVLYSGDNGLRWTGIATTDGASCPWRVPYRNHRTDQALVLVIASGMSSPANNSPRSASGKFTILAAPADKYEPNNDFASAYPISVGDSVVKDAVVIAYDPMDFQNGTTYYMPVLTTDSADRVNESLTADNDVFKIALTGGKLAIFSAVASVRSSPSPFYLYAYNPAISLYDASQENAAVAYDGRSLSFAVPRTGNYYCWIYCADGGEWYKYNLSIREATVLSSQKSFVDSNAFQRADNAYKVQLVADTTKVTIGMLLSRKADGIVTTMVLSADEIAPAAGTKVNVKVVSISADPTVSSLIKTVEIAIPYNIANLNGVRPTRA